MKTLRLLPVVILAASALLVLKVAGIVTGGGYVLTGTSAVSAQESAEGNDISAADLAARALFESTPSATEGGEAIPTRQFGQGTDTVFAQDDTERVLLERLAARRAELDALAEEIELRLAVVEAAESRLEERMTELAAIEANINAAMDAKDTQEAQQFAGLVAMYENMRPADAATIFNDLDMNVLLRVSTSMNPRKLGPIMAKMLPAKAQILTVRMAAIENETAPAAPQDGFGHLPQIVGQ